MKLFRYFLISAIILLFWSPFALCLDQKTIEESRAIAFSDWSVKANPSVFDMSFSKSSYKHFFALMEDIINDNELKEIQINEIDFEKPADLYLRYLGDFEWVDMDGDGQYELLGVIVWVRGVDKFYVIKRNEVKFKIQQIKVCYNIYQTEDHKFEDIIKDIEQDGKYELVLPVPIDEDSCIPFWTKIYKWNGDKYQDASEQFKNYYQNVLLDLTDKRIRTLKKVFEKSRSEMPFDKDKVSMDEGTLAAEQLIRDKIIRFIGKDTLSGV